MTAPRPQPEGVGRAPTAGCVGWRVAQATTRIAIVAVVAALAPPAIAQNRYVAFGDSITEGVGDSVPEGPEAGYPIRLQALLGSATVRNYGKSGERTPEGLTRINQVLLDGGDVLLLMEGTNDISRRISLEATLFNLAEMARKAGTFGLSVVHATTIPRLPNAKVDSTNLVNQQLNQGIRHLAGTTGRNLADNFEIFSRLGDLYADYYWDEPTDPVGHPNPAGYDEMAKVFADVIQGRDRVPPVAGLLHPNHGDDEVPADSTIEVELWDFGAGIDTSSLTLRINGALVNIVPSLGTRSAIFRYTPAAALQGVVRVRVGATDRAPTPNASDRTLAVFSIEGTTFIDGDLDHDGRVDGADLFRMAIAFGASSGDRTWDALADINKDGIVDGLDLAVLGSNFGRSL